MCSQQDENKVKMEELHKEIDLIQACITRMAQNSFMIKGWFVTLYAAIFAFTLTKVDTCLMCVALMLVNIAFWYLDAYFLRMERQYRKIYEEVLEKRKNGDIDLMYELNPRKFKVKVESTVAVMFSRTVWPFYLFPLIIVIVIFGLFLKEKFQ